MKKFEYSVVRYYSHTPFIEFCNTQGQNGWEFCMELSRSDAFTDFLVKRVKE